MPAAKGASAFNCFELAPLRRGERRISGDVAARGRATCPNVVKSCDQLSAGDPTGAAPPDGQGARHSVRVIGAGDVQSPHLVLQRRSLEAQAVRGAALAGYSPGC